jgi:hypothetical protein
LEFKEKTKINYESNEEWRTSVLDETYQDNNDETQHEKKTQTKDRKEHKT